mgnify:CR=1 FL=1
MTEECDNLPRGWDYECLGQLGVWSGGGTPSKANDAYWTNGTIPWVSPKDMKSERIRSSEDLITEEATQRTPAKPVPPGSVLMVTRSGILAHTFPVAVTERVVAINQDLKSLTPYEGIDANFVAWCLRYRSSAILAECGKHGTTVASIEMDRLRKLRVPVAPAKEQRRIVEKIESLFAELDKGEESLRQVQTLLARYRQSVLKAAVTGELTADWRARHAGKLEHGRDLLARILKARRENWQGRGKYKEPVEPDTANLLELPDGWVWASLSQITWIKGGITVDKKRNPTNPITLPYLRVANVQNGYLDLSHVREITVEAEKAEECLLKPGDILLNEGGDRDKLGRGWVWSGEIERCIHQNHVFRARPVLAELSSKFVSFYANAFGQPFFMQKGKQSVNLASISLTAISGLPIPLPPVEEQREIVELLEDKLGEIGQLEKACEHELSRSSALRRSVLRHAFAGKLVPQDLNDEPASKLLERIRSQRETANCKTTREAVTA